MTIIKHSKTFLRHKASLDAGMIGPAFIRGVKCALNNADRQAKGYSTSRAFSGMSLAELATLNYLIEHNGPRVNADLEAKGLKWLRSRKVRRMLDEFQCRVADDFSHFTLAGFDDQGQQVAFMVPMYTVHARNGKRFTYSAASWQSDGMVTFHD